MSEEGRFKTAIERIIEQTIPQVDYFAQYPGVIVSQSGQTFDFQPDSPNLPGLTGLKFYSGTPGIEITVDKTKTPRAVLFFENGSPAAPALSVFSAPGLATIKLTASTEIDLLAPTVKVGNNATLNAARKTDAVSAATSMAAWIQAVITAWAGNTGAPVTIPPPTDFGLISGGSSEVKIG